MWKLEWFAFPPKAYVSVESVKAIWTAVWGQVNNDEQLSSLCLFSDHPDCGGISCIRTRWVVKSSMAGWLSTDITWICKVNPTFSPVKHWKWVSSFPSFLWPYKMYFSLLVIISSLSWSLCRYLSSTTPQHPPWAPSTLLMGQEPTLTTSPYLSNDSAGLVSATPAWPQVLWAWSTHKSMSGLSPTLVGMSNGQGWSWAGEMMKYDEAYPCPGFRGITRLETARIGFSKETDGFLGEGKPIGIFPS